MFHKRTLTVVLAVVAAAVMAVSFAGCKKKAAASTQSSDQGRGGFNTEEMEKRYKTGLAELVSAGTITKAQSEKIYSVLTERFASMQKGGSRPSGSGGGKFKQAPSGSASDLPEGSPSDMPNGDDGSQSGAASDSGSRPNGSRGGNFGSQMLQSLVKDGTITQAQSEAVMQKLMDRADSGSGGQSAASSK